VDEFRFELRVCRWAERRWKPAREDSAVLVARQLGTRSRRWDTVVVEADPEGLYARGAFGDGRLDGDLLEVVRHAPREWAWYREALPEPSYPWRYVREAVHRAGDRGVAETRKRDGRVELRRKWRYPDWVRRVVAIENKPDLDASAARDMADQLERDVALELADEAWVATRATGADVEPALFESLPVEAGILALDDDGEDRVEAEVVWNATALAPGEPGTRVVERPSGSDRDASAARFEYVDPDWKADKRLEVAERAYERGWRSFVDTMRPDCRHFRLRDVADGPVPWCAAKGPQRAAECSGSCPDFEPEPPTWRRKGWPIEGGPGRGARRLLERQRDRRP
jgi:hypothetical protein